VLKSLVADMRVTILRLVITIEHLRFAVRPAIITTAGGATPSARWRKHEQRGYQDGR
jgi:hypothetical protein